MCLDAGRHVHGMAHRVSLSDLRKSENLFVLSLEAVGGWVGCWECVDGWVAKVYRFWVDLTLTRGENGRIK